MIYIDLGRREMGKTTLAFDMVRRCGKRVIFDPRCQFVIAGGFAALSGDDISEGFERLLGADNPPDLLDEFVVQPQHDPQLAFDSLMRASRRWLKDTHAPLALLLDEVTFVDLMGNGDFEFLLRASPRQQLHIVLTGHRPKDIDVNIRAIADEWLMFRTVQKHDLDVIEERCGEDARRQLPNLAPFEFLQWDDARGVLQKHKPLLNFARINNSTAQASSLAPPDGKPTAPLRLFP